MSVCSELRVSGFIVTYFYLAYGYKRRHRHSRLQKRYFKFQSMLQNARCSLDATKCTSCSVNTTKCTIRSPDLIKCTSCSPDVTKCTSCSPDVTKCTSFSPDFPKAQVVHSMLQTCFNSNSYFRNIKHALIVSQQLTFTDRLKTFQNCGGTRGKFKIVLVPSFRVSLQCSTSAAMCCNVLQCYIVRCSTNCLSYSAL